MAITPTPKIWMNGELVAWDEARIHVLTHTLHYGMGVFEGIRAYGTADGPAIFRLTEHIHKTVIIDYDGNVGFIPALEDGSTADSFGNIYK